MTLEVDEIVGLFGVRGASTYGGEAVSQLDHALQCAQLAEESGSTLELVAACLLHDLGLSPASQRSLALQGGPHSAPEAKMFLARPYADCAVRLRRWDDLAKVPRKGTPDLNHYAQILEGCAFPAYAPGTRWT